MMRAVVQRMPVVSKSLLVLLMCTAWCGRSIASDLDVVNDLRVKECPRALGKDQRLRSNANLRSAARYVNDGQRMREALARAEYRADRSAEIHATGIGDDAAFKALLLRSYCKTLTDPGLTEVGIDRRGSRVALVFGSPFAPPAPKNATQISQDVLRLVNAARAKSRRCGMKSFKSVPPLTLNEKLYRAALAHAKDMAARGEVAHEGSDGSSPDERATRAGYFWRSVGENVAGGHLTAAEVVQGWLDSPHHCENIMDPDFTQMAVAFAINPKERYGIYWAQEFGKPR